MAHKGRIYPVHFRRDLSLLSSVPGAPIPDAWLVRAGPLVGSWAPMTNYLEKAAYVVLAEPGTTFVCETDDFASAGRTWHLVFKLELQETYPRYISTLEVWESTLGKMLSATYNLGVPGAYATIDQPWAGIYEQDPSKLSFGAFDFAGRAIRVAWANYPPS